MNNLKTSLSLKTPRKIMQAARGERCTLNIGGVCEYDTKTTVGCHLPMGGGGSNRLSGPLALAFGCHSCHFCIDNPGSRDHLSKTDLEFYMRRGQNRTIHRLIDLGLIRVDGL